jgi:glutathione S-transferase
LNLLIQDDDGFQLFESRAIARYLINKYGKDSGLIPSEPKANALFEQAASIEAFNFDKYASEIVFERVFKVYVLSLEFHTACVLYDGYDAYSRRGLQTDEAYVNKLTEAFKGKLAAYEALLGKTKYLAGDSLTLADLFHLSYGTMLSDAGVTLLTDGTFPNVTRWVKFLRDHRVLTDSFTSF